MVESAMVLLKAKAAILLAFKIFQTPVTTICASCSACSAGI